MVALALVAMAIVLGKVLFAEVEPARWARAWGGPTEGPAPLVLRLELGSTEPGSAFTRDCRIRVDGPLGRHWDRSLQFDSDGQAYVRLPTFDASSQVTVLQGTRPLASGRLQLTREDFWRHRKLRTGWLRESAQGGLLIKVGYHEGGLALGHPGHLGVLVTGQPQKAWNGDLCVEFEGLTSADGANPKCVVMNAEGALLGVIPRDLSASIRLTLGEPHSPIVTYFTSVPIEPRSLVGTLRDGRVLIESHVPLQRAYFSLVNDQGRWAAGGVTLNCDANGHCQGEFAVDDPPTTPAWLMVGNEPALDGPNVFGWPVVTTPSALVSDTVVVKEQLLLDGKPAALAAAATAARRRLGRIAMGVLVAGLVLSFGIGRAMLHARGRRVALESALASIDSASIIERRGGAALALLAFLALSLLALLLWAKSKISGG